MLAALLALAWISPPLSVSDGLHACRRNRLHVAKLDYADGALAFGPRRLLVRRRGGQPRLKRLERAGEIGCVFVLFNELHVPDPIVDAGRQCADGPDASAWRETRSVPQLGAAWPVSASIVA